MEERDLILQIADSLGLTLVSGSNHHGWGRTAAAWNLIRVPGWQELRPEELGAEIEAIVRGSRADRIQIAERRRIRLYAPRESPLVEALTAPRLAVHILRSLTFPERLAWLPWIAACVLVAVRRRPAGAA